MKTRLLSFFAMLSSAGFLQAQITIQSDFMATVGDTISLAEDISTAALLNLGTTSGNQTWDFTMLEEDLPDGAILELPSTAPLSSNFPDADFVINDLTDDSVHIFFKQTSLALDIVGIVEYDSLGNPTLPEFSFNFRYMQFPASYGDTFMTDNFAFAQVEYLGIDPDSIGPHPTIDSLRGKIYLESISYFDAWGDLKLPGGTFTALRHWSFNRARIESDWYGNGQWRPFSESFILQELDSVQYDTSDNVTLRWWTNDAAVNFWLCEIELDTNGNAKDSISFYPGAPEPPLHASLPADNSLKVYPNPASDQLRIDRLPEPGMVIELIDVGGRIVYSDRTKGNSHLVDTATLPEGVYLLMLQDDQRVRLMEKVQIVR